MKGLVDAKTHCGNAMSHEPHAFGEHGMRNVFLAIGPLGLQHAFAAWHDFLKRACCQQRSTDHAKQVHNICLSWMSYGIKQRALVLR